MMRTQRSILPALLLAAAAMIGMQGCASLEPLPRFRTSSTSFAPEQLPLAQRSASDLLDPATVGAYSVVKEEAARKAGLTLTAEETQRLVVNQSAHDISMHVDEVGLDREQLDDELAAGEEFNAEEPAVDEAIVQRVLSRAAAGEPLENAEEVNPSVNRAEMMREIVNLLGIPYRYGGVNAARGLDCSAFVGTVYSRVFGVRLPRSSNEQFGTGAKIRKSDLKIGDLVFFKTRRRRGPVSHVGIYVGSNLFAHASTKHGVIVSTLEAGYYDRTYVGARRVLTTDLTELNKLRGIKAN